ncbi:MAG: hypothetical protein MZV63_44010 [Marinilabiliales bacterium]|nr:hypothetical protein [Marinilabiliales bacterium]
MSKPGLYLEQKELSVLIVPDPALEAAEPGTEALTTFFIALSFRFKITIYVHPEKIFGTQRKAFGTHRKTSSVILAELC